MYKCDNCGHQAAEGANFCLQCGSAIHKPKPAAATRKKRNKKIYKFSEKVVEKRSGVPGWMKILGVFVIAIVAYFFLMNDTSEPYGNKDYTGYSDNVELVDDSYKPDNIENTISVISENSDPELERVKQEYIEAYTKYTKLVTTGGEGDVQEALADYKEKYFKYIALVDAVMINVNFSHN